MPKRQDISSIMIIGAGPIVIGQACEFDYSGTQACKAIKSEGYRVILVNSNPATIMTDPDLADTTYIEPITPMIVAKIIEKERPDAILPTMGGQTALNCALSLRKMGILKKFNVEMIGADADAIDKAEDRNLFRKAMQRIGLETPRSAFVNTYDLKKKFVAEREKMLSFVHSDAGKETTGEAHWKAKELEESYRIEKHRIVAQDQALEAAKKTGLPAIVRPSFTMGGMGGGIAYTLEELYDLVIKGIDASPTNEVLVEESIVGWKEYEMEVVRDRNDNCIIICSIENVDPMGVHTGDSITVAPALTLTDKDYQLMRNAAIKVLREIGVETGGSNVQFAVNPDNGRMVVIEMNPRVSRSSALASKATGFPIAKVAALLAVGYTLDELKNDITDGATPASFEPSIDYVVTKIPRFAFEKFSGAKPYLTTSMKSIGEVMAIGRTFPESLQKALRGLETGLNGLNEIELHSIDQGDDENTISAALSTPCPDRILKIAQAIRFGISLEKIQKISGYDLWFIRQIKEIIDLEQFIKSRGLPEDIDNLRLLKSMGFSDLRLAELSGKSIAEVIMLRNKLGLHPVYKRIDTCAGEFFSPTAYMYSTYEAPFSGHTYCESKPDNLEKIIVIGGGPNRIGQGIEFDYCCCHAAFALKEVGIQSIMINCNPETVSTDYDTSDRLYFEPLTAEDILEIIHKEQSSGTLLGVIVQFGGQTPLNLVAALKKAGVAILGTSAEAIDLAENRDQFQNLLFQLNLNQPRNEIAYSEQQARQVISKIGYPVVIRPSYVIGGQAMEIIHSQAQFELYIKQALPVSNDTPLLIDSYLSGATELDVDCLCDGKQVFICAIMEHIEEAGIHSGDSACILPSRSISGELLNELKLQTKMVALALNVKGLMNIQFAIKNEKVYILEANTRASRTVPFVAKTIGEPIAKIATRIMVGSNLEQARSAYCRPGSVLRNVDDKLKHIAIKEAVFPFSRFPGVDVLLGPEMRSTGEVMGLDSNFAMAFAKSQLAAGNDLPLEGTIFMSVKDIDKPKILDMARKMLLIGYKLIATGGTQKFLIENGLTCKRINKVLEGRPNIEDAIKNHQIHLVINTTEGTRALADSRYLRQAALLNGIPHFTTIAGARAVCEALEALKQNIIEVKSLQAYHCIS